MPRTPDPLSPQYRQIIRQWRIQNQLTITSIAQAIGYTREGLSRVLNGQRGVTTEFRTTLWRQYGATLPSELHQAKTR